MKSQEVSSKEFKELVRRLKELPKTPRSIQLLFWYKKGDRGARLLHLMRDLVEKY